ncbi:MAG: efflux RND transporter periplasmic adaptor subunit [Gammaproteobacteria bacterium]|nr:efflux RND transporter periplasmic adaptor subunit [Gammaproteobacteria bacterium]
MKTQLKFTGLFISFILLTLAGCNKKNNSATEGRERIITVQQKPDLVMLPYTGKISPAQVVTVTNPEEGVVSKMNFKYGQEVKKDQFLLSLNSVKLEADFHEAVSNFLKAKDRYLISQTNFSGSSDLYKEKIISRQEFTNEKSQHENDELAYIDAKFKLEKILDYVPGFDKSIEKINLKDIKHIERIFATSMEDLVIKAPAAGIILFPVQVKSDEGTGELVVGSEIKKGQALVSIGDLNGITVDFQVNEADINRVKPEQTVIVSTSGAHSVTLTGQVKSIAVQAKNIRGGNEAASFPATAHVEKITPEQREYIRVGMSAKVMVKIPGKTEIMIPISAIKSEKGKRWVTVVDASGKRDKREVNTGHTTLTDVIVTQGLKSGEKIVVHENQSSNEEENDD